MTGPGALPDGNYGTPAPSVPPSSASQGSAHTQQPDGGSGAQNGTQRVEALLAENDRRIRDHDVSLGFRYAGTTWVRAKAIRDALAADMTEEEA